MKKSKIFLASVLSLSLLFICSIGVLGSLALGDSSKPTITLITSGGHANFIINRNNSNLFDNFSNVMPGDSVTQEVLIESSSSNNSRFNIYMYAVPVSETNPGFLSSVGLKVFSGNTELNVMDANYQTGAVNSNVKGVSLGTFNPGDKKTLSVLLTLPIEMNNDFQNAESMVDWHFYAEEVAGSIIFDYSPEPNNSPTPIPTVIPDDDTPTGDKPDIDIPDDDIPTGNLPSEIGNEAVPKTGDNSLLLMWVVIMVLSGSTLICLLIFRRKSQATE